MTLLYPAQVTQLTLAELATLTVADGKDVVHVPCDLKLFRVRMYVGTTGTGSGNVDATVYYTKPSDGITATGDLWTVASGVGRIAYNASAKYLEWDADSLLITNIEAGGTLSLNVDTISTAPANLVIHLLGIPINAS